MVSCLVRKRSRALIQVDGREIRPVAQSYLPHGLRRRIRRRANLAGFLRRIAPPQREGLMRRERGIPMLFATAGEKDALPEALN